MDGCDDDHGDAEPAVYLLEEMVLEEELKYDAGDTDDNERETYT